MNKETHIKEYVSRINKVIDYIENNLNTDLSLDTLSATANFSKFHFHRIFKFLVGETLNKYINRIRLEKAVYMLDYQKEKTITDVAYDCGYTSNAVFAKVFKNRFGMSASEWREKQIQQKSKNRQQESKNDKSDISISPYFRNIFNNQKEKNMKSLQKVEIKDLSEMTVAYVRHIGAYAGNENLFVGLINKLMSWAGPRGLVNFPETVMLTAYHDDPKITDEEKLRISVCITVPEDTKVDGEIGKMKIAGGKYLVASFEMDVEEYSDAWAFAYKEVMEKGYQPADSLSFEIGKNNPEEHPEHKHIVDICVPVKAL